MALKLSLRISRLSLLDHPLAWLGDIEQASAEHAARIVYPQCLRYGNGQHHQDDLNEGETHLVQRRQLEEYLCCCMRLLRCVPYCQWRVYDHSRAIDPQDILAYGIVPGCNAGPALPNRIWSLEHNAEAAITVE